MIDYLAKTLGKSNDSVTELIFKKSDDGKISPDIADNALELLETAHADHVKGLGGDDLKAEYDKGHQAGKFEALSKAETDLKKKFNVEGKKIDDIVNAAILAATKAESSEDKVLTHPLFVGLKADSEAAIEALKTEYESKISEIKTTAEKQARFSQHLPDIDQAMQEAGVVMPKNPAAAKTLKSAFLEQFKAYDFDANETGTYLKDSNGKLLKDAHGHPITLSAFTKAKSSEWFDIEKQPGRKTPGNDPNDPTAPATKWTKDNVPKSADEFQTAYFNITDPLEQSALAKAFEESQTGG